MLRPLIPNGHLDYGIGARCITYLVSPKKKLCITFVFLFLLGIKVVPREVVNNANANKCLLKKSTQQTLQAKAMNFKKPLGKPKSVSLSFNSWADNSFPFFFIYFYFFISSFWLFPKGYNCRKFAKCLAVIFFSLYEP